MRLTNSDNFIKTYIKCNKKDKKELKHLHFQQHSLKEPHIRAGQLGKETNQDFFLILIDLDFRFDVDAANS